MRRLISLCALLTACGGPHAPAQTADDAHVEQREERSAEPDAAAPPLSSEGTQGIMGRVSILTGDHMPGIYDPDDPMEGPDHDSLRGSPAASAPVHVLRGRHTRFERLDRSASHYVGSTTTGADGGFRVALPPGVYTVLTEHDGLLYLNRSQGDGTWSTLTVAEGEWTETAIQDSADATF
ncbi:MAG: carboxypeptidase-like regulatory domain-containing protein [Sandaracinaceae bacterium]